jgi:hypothetical protein
MAILVWLLAPRQNIYTTRTAAKHSKPENPDSTYCMMRSTLYVVLLVIVIISRCFLPFNFSALCFDSMLDYGSEEYYC